MAALEHGHFDSFNELKSDTGVHQKLVSIRYQYYIGLGDIYPFLIFQIPVFDFLAKIMQIFSGKNIIGRRVICVTKCHFIRKHNICDFVVIFHYVL